MGSYNSNKNKEGRRTLLEVTVVYDIDCGDGFMVFTYLQTHQVLRIKHVQLFVCPLYLKVALKKKINHRKCC